MKSLRFFLPRIEYIFLIAVFWGIVAAGPRILNFDGDLPRHILTGNLILQRHSVATTDIFSFRTTGYPSFPHEWLSQVIFAAVYDWLGLDGIVLLTALMITLTWGLVYQQAIKKSRSFFAALIFIALGVAASQLHVLPRPHLFTYVMTAIWITVLEAMEENRTRVWWLLPALMLIWVNLHGMFILGIGILGIYLIGDFLDRPATDWFRTNKTKSLLAAAGLSLLATLISPSGPKIWEAIASLGSNAYITSKIPEYQSPDFHSPSTWPFVLILLLTIIGFARASKKPSWIQVLLFVSFAGMGLYTSRMIPLFAIVAVPIAAQTLAGWVREEYGTSRLLTVEENIYKINTMSKGWIWILVVVLVTAGLLRSGTTLDPLGQGNVFDSYFFPVEAVSWLEAHPQNGHMFNEFDWGGYLLLKLWPRYQIFMDGHTHIYGETLTREYEKVISLGKDWNEILDHYEVRWVILRTNTSLAEALSSSPAWVTAYKDQTAIILVRK